MKKKKKLGELDGFLEMVKSPGRKSWGREWGENKPSESLQEMSPEERAQVTHDTCAGSMENGASGLRIGSLPVRGGPGQWGVDWQALTVREEAGAEGDVSDTIS